MVIQKRLVDIFLELVRINGPSLHERPVADHILSRMAELEVPVFEDDAGSKFGGNCGNLIIRLGGDGEPLLLAAHLDTVRPTAGILPLIADDRIKSDGSTILGADNRAGVAVLLYLIETLIDNKTVHRPLEIVFTVAEELGMYGAQQLDFTTLSSKEGYILDCSRDVGCYVATTPTAMDLKIEAHGRAAHAGIAPEKGVNALSMMLAVLHNFPVGRIDEKTTANIGVIKGGEGTNVVPDHITALGEIRSFDDVKITEMQLQLQQQAGSVSHEFGGHITVECTLGFKGFKLDDQAPVRRLEQVLRGMGFQPEGLVYYGGSDANVYNDNGIVAVNLGIGAANPHSNEEYITLHNLTAAAELVTRLVRN